MILLVGFSLYMHFVTYMGWFSYFYYLIYFLPASLLVIITLTGKMMSERRNASKALIICGAFLIPVFSFVNWQLLPITLANHFGIICIFFILIFFGLLSGFWKYRIVGYIAVLAAYLLVIPILLVGNGGSANFKPTGFGLFSTATVNWEMKDWDTYHAAVYMQKIVNRTVPLTAHLTFWYTNKPSALNSIQSMFLWGYSRLVSADTTALGMPYFDPKYREIMKPGLTVVMLSETQEELNLGTKSLFENHVNFRNLQTDSYLAPGYNLYFSIIEIAADL